MSDITAPDEATRAGLGERWFVGLAGLGDAALVWAWLAAQVPTPVVIVLHCCLVIALGAFDVHGQRLPQAAGHRAGRPADPVRPVGGFMLAIAGPQAAAQPAAAAATRPESAPEPAPARKAAEPSKAEALFAQIRQGRRHPHLQRSSSHFLETLRSGTLVEQQDTVAAISRSYHPRMRPALSAALASPVPAIRVQAAAVYARLRGTYEARAKDLLARGGSAALPFGRALADECLLVADSGFVDADSCERLRNLAALGMAPDGDADANGADPAAPTAAAAAPQAADPALARPALEPVPRLKRHSCGGLA